MKSRQLSMIIWIPAAVYILRLPGYITASFYAAAQIAWGYLLTLTEAP